MCTLFIVDLRGNGLPSLGPKPDKSHDQESPGLETVLQVTMGLWMLPLLSDPIVSFCLFSLLPPQVGRWERGVVVGSVLRKTKQVESLCRFIKHSGPSASGRSQLPEELFSCYRIYPQATDSCLILWIFKIKWLKVVWEKIYFSLCGSRVWRWLQVIWAHCDFSTALMENSSCTMW